MLEKLKNIKMPRKKSTRKKRGTYKPNPRYGGDGITMTERELGLFLATEKLKEAANFQAFETEIGTIKIHPDADILSLPKATLAKLLAYEVVHADEFDEDDEIEFVRYLEKMVAEFPDLPHLAHQLVDVYRHFNRDEDPEELAIENYKKFKGELLIDVRYMASIHDEEGRFTNEEIFGDILNPHDIYSNRSFFTTEELINYLSTQIYYYINNGNPDIAQKLVNTLEVITSENRRTIQGLNFEIRKKRNPIRYKIHRYLMIVLMLLIVVGVIWGVVALVRWIIGWF
jgi:hypothetical protein